MINVIRPGLEALPLRAELKTAALTQLQRWLTEPRFIEYRPYIEALAARQDFNTLLDSFYQMIPFGTGGRRGPIGVGPNRMNPYTLATSVQGHVLYLRERYGRTQGLSVVVACDVRIFHDLRGLFPGVTGPLTGLTSRALSWLAARVYAANGVTVHLLPQDEDSYISTPELSFLIRHLHASGGLNISASHNHPDDNGGKFYNALGGQEIPPDDEVMAAIVERVEDAALLDLDAALASGHIVPVTPDQRRAYLEHNRSLLPAPASTSAAIVYTPLNGTGSTTVLPLLREAGFSLVVEPAQAAFDGAFPAIPFRIPNPEVPQSMDRARALAQTGGAQLVLSTDPDADRLGLLAPDAQGRWQALTGNEIATLLLHHLLDKRATQPRQGTGRPFVVTTWVTTSMLERLARAAGAQCVSSLLVGFKYIAHVLRSVEETGRYHEEGWDRTLEASLGDFVLATEESHGFLVTPEIRDKDAAGAALLLAELASLQRDRGETLLDLLDQIQLTHGVVVNHLISMVMQGAPGLEQIARIQTSLRAEPPQSVGGSPVVRIIDWHDEARFGPIRSGTDRSARNVLCFLLADETRITLRPSGTEPKNKTYVEVAGQPLPQGSSLAILEAERDRLRHRATEVADDFVTQAMARVGVAIPRAALRISDLVPVEQRLRVVQQVVPELLTRLHQLEQQQTELGQVRDWLDRELRPCGNDARGLVGDGIRAALEDHPHTTSLHAWLERVLEE